MNSVHFVYPRPRIGFGFVLGASVLAISLSSTAVASPPSKAEREVSRGLEKVGNFFFKVARKLEQAGFTEEPEPRYFDERPKVRQEPSSDEQIDPSTGLVLPPRYPEGYRRIRPQGPPPPVNGSQRPAPRYREQQQPNGYQPPNFQENPQPRVTQPRQSTAPLTSPAPLPPSRSQLSIPVNPSTEPIRDVSREPSLGATTAPQESLSPEVGGDARSASPSAAPKPSPSVTLPFAEPVPGKRGFVYPPGAEHDMKSMLDVRDFTPGQKVRDPRTGKMFLVPPTDGSN